MAPIDLNQATAKFMRERGEPYKSINFGRLKLKVVGEPVWSKQNNRPQPNSATRIVDMTNNSNETGEGHLRIEKEGKPVFKFHLSGGVVMGLPYRVKFEGPRGVLKEFWAPVNQGSSVIQDHTGLTMDSVVPLQSRSSASARVSNKTDVYRGSFSCEAQLSGNVQVIHFDDSVTDIPVKDLVTYTTIDMKGSIEIDFQNTHNIHFQ